MSHSVNLRRSTRLARTKSTAEERAKSDVINVYVNDADDHEDVIDAGNVYCKSANSATAGSALKGDRDQELQHVQGDVRKPIELFSDRDICGQAMYGFQSVSKKNAMTEKANVCRSSVTPIVLPKSVKSLKVVLQKMETSDGEAETSTNENEVVAASTRGSPLKEPFRSSARIPLSDSESVSEDSEFIPSDSEASTESEENESESENTSDTEKIRLAEKNKWLGCNRSKSVIRPSLLYTPKRQGRNDKRTFTYQDYRIKTDEYFEKQAEKTVTSDRTLSKLANPRLTEEKLQRLLINQEHVTAAHRKGVRTLTENCRMFFPLWHFILEEGYGLLLHGVGSKRNLINDFHKEVVINHPALVVNGFFPSLTIKDVLDGIIVDLLGLDSPTHPSECVDLIEDVLRNNPKDRLYLLIHNIDGAMLRGKKCQDILAALAAIPNVCVLASVDHVNGPLLWDHGKRSKFNFYWWDATTLLPYVEETSYESSLLVQRSGALALSSLRNVFLSLTTNARSIYIILVKYQLENAQEKNFTGMAFRDLYRTARESFLVSSDLALRAQLTEFIDHKLVRTKRNIDGAEHLLIPLNNSLLKQFLEQHK